MNVLFVTVSAVILLFGLVVFFGAPYLPTLGNTADDVFRLLNLRPGQTLLELGSGDGRILLAAGKRGIHAIGYELNPLLVLWAIAVTWRYRKVVTVKWGNFWWAKWPETDAIYTFLLQKYMKKLDKKVVQTYGSRPVKLVSLAFTISNKKPVKQKGALYLYQY